MATMKSFRRNRLATTRLAGACLSGLLVSLLVVVPAAAAVPDTGYVPTEPTFTQALKALKPGRPLAPTAAVAPGHPAGRGPWYLAVGASFSVGWQPTPQSPGGQRTDHGYASVLTTAEQAAWPGLQLREIGCPGDTTQNIVAGGGACPYPLGSQLAQAVAFLHGHRNTVLVTVDVGFDDLRPCILGGNSLDERTFDMPCVSQTLTQVGAQVVQIIQTLKAAGPSRMLILGLGHDDPWLAALARSPGGAVFAAESGVAIAKLDQTLRQAYRQAGVSLAEVGTAFRLYDTRRTYLAGRGTFPENVVRACLLTWICGKPPEGPNLHPNDRGYRAYARAIAATLALRPVPRDN